MKYPCDMICDLLPLYCDSVCSKSSADAVREHMSECESCRAVYDSMTQAESVDNSEYEQRKIKSMKSVKKKMRRKQILPTVLLVIAAVLARFVFYPALITIVAAFGLSSSTVRNSYAVNSDDVAVYSLYFGENAEERFRDKYNMDESIFPPEITADMDAEEFRFQYIDFLDKEYAAFLDVKYTDSDFKKELHRLSGKDHDEYVGMFSVTGEPDGYDIVAMDSGYYGFVYAMIPESGSPEVVYVMTVFPDMYMSTDMYREEPVPEKFMLKGFNAGADNPDKREWLKKNK